MAIRRLLRISFFLSLSGEFFLPFSTSAAISNDILKGHLGSIKGMDTAIISEDIQKNPLFEEESHKPARRIRLDRLSIKELNDLLIKTPDNKALLKYLGLAYGKAGNNQKAKEIYRKIIKLYPHSWKVHRKLGDTYYYLRQYKKAIEAYQNTLKYQPDDISTHSNMGTAFFRISDIGNAIKHFNKVLEGDPDHLITLNNLGLLYLRSGEAEKSIPFLEKANRIDPTHLLRKVQLGKAYENAGKFIEAERYYFKILRENDKYVAGYNSLAEFYLYRLDQPESAIEYFKKSLEIAPDQPRSWEIKNILQKLELEMETD